jgi:nucleotide-binding universal stress UspA family protein
MRVLIAVSRNPDGCSDPLAAVVLFPWPAEAVFSVLTVAEIVAPPPMLEAVPLAADLTYNQTNADVAAHITAATAAAELKSRGFNADGIDREGDPKAIIVDYAKKWGADLIVIGSCEKSRIEKFFLGSVSESVIKHAPCSVLIVKPGTLDTGNA